MRRFLVLFAIASVASIFFAGTASADVMHNIRMEGKELAITSTLILQSENLIDFWNLTISLPEKAELISVNDDLGAISYSLNSNLLEFRTNSRKSKIHIVNITYAVSDWKETAGLRQTQLSLFGFKNDTTYLKVESPLPYVFIPGAQVEYSENEIKAKKIGPANVIIVYGGKYESDHYFTNSELSLSDAEDLYPIIEGVTGLKAPVKFGVAVIPEEQYQDEYKEWSAGTFNGIIVVKQSKNKNEMTATIIHETVHGFNQFALGWNMANASWFDEGTASYITSAAYRILGEQQPDLFGDKKVWRNKTIIYTLEPKKTPQDLWNYYLYNETFMYYWYPQSDYDREFGYAYSELFIREYVGDYGNELQRVYHELLLVNETVYDMDESNEILLDILGADFKPCYSSVRVEVERCAKELNAMSFKIPNADGKEIGQFVEEPPVPRIDGNVYVEYLTDLWRTLTGNLGMIWDFVVGIFS